MDHGPVSAALQIPDFIEIKDLLLVPAHDRNPLFIFLGPSFFCDPKKLFKDIRVHRLREISHEIDRLKENMLGISRRISGQGKMICSSGNF